MAAGAWLVFVAIACGLTYFRNSGGLAASEGAWHRRVASAFEVVASAWLRGCGLYPRLTAWLPQLIRYCEIVYGRDSRYGPEPAFAWSALRFGWTAAAGMIAVAAALAEVDPAIAVMLLCIMAAVPIVSWGQVRNAVEERKAAIVAELPAFMLKLSLQLAAGETLHRAWLRASEAGEARQSHPLYKELARTCKDIECGIPFARALEEMHRRSGFYEVGTLITTVLMNYKRGGEAFALALQDSARLLMEKKQALIRMRGEKASTKLLFPMMLMLLAVMVIVAAPAVMLMS